MNATGPCGSRSRAAFHLGGRRRTVADGGRVLGACAFSLVLLVLIEEAALGQGWWNADWTRRRRLTFDNSARSENLLGFPVLVTLDGSRVDYTRTRNGGQDLRFLDADGGTVLDYEIEEWNESGTSYVWVRVPRIDASSATDHIWMYYGNSGAPDGQNAAGVWSAGYVGVWHLHDDFLDSTSSGNDGAGVGSADATGYVADGQEFDGSTSYVAVRNSGSLQIRDALTISGWVNLDSLDPSDSYVATIVRKGGGNPNNYQFGVDESRVALFLDDVDGGGLHGETTLGTGRWHYAAGTWDGSEVMIYLDGARDLVAPGSHTSQLGWDDRDLYIGGRPSNDFLDGTLDEVRVSDLARTSAWISAQYASMTDGLIAFGAEEMAGSGSLPPPWSHSDVGPVGIAGTASYSDGTFTVTGDGSDIWGYADEFHYAYRAITGDCEIVARLASRETGVHLDAKAAVMIRENVDGLQHPDAYHVMLTHNERGMTYLTHRSTLTGGDSQIGGSLSLSTPCWLRLVRSGASVTAYASPDPNTSPWQEVGRIDAALSADVFVGLAVTSHDADVLCTATFDNVAVTVPPGAFALLEPAPDATGVSITPAVDWGDSAGAEAYSLVVDDDADFSSPVVDETGLWESAYAVGGGVLDLGTTYYWKVTAVSGMSSGTWSTDASGSGRSFTTAAEPPPPPAPLDYLGGGCCLRPHEVQMQWWALALALFGLRPRDARRRPPRAAKNRRASCVLAESGVAWAARE